MTAAGARWWAALRQRHRRSAALAALALLVVAAGAVYLWARHEWAAAQAAIGRGRFADALPHLERYLQVWPRSTAGHLLAARTARRAAAFDDARRHLEECRRLDGPTSEGVLLEEALLRAQVGDLTPAVRGYLDGLVKQQHPDAALILEALGQGYFELMSFPTAQRYLDQCLALQPDNVKAWQWHGLVQERLLQYADAAKDYERVVALDPDHREARLRLADCLLRTGRAEDAAVHYAALAQDPERGPAAVVGLARCRYQAGHADEAARLLDGLLATHPDHAAALRERGRLALEAFGDPAAGERYLRRAVDADRVDMEANNLLSLCLRQQGKAEEARAYQARSDLAQADLLRLGEIMTRDMPNRPRDPALHCELGVLFLRNGKTGQGLHWLESALRLDPTSRCAHEALAGYYEKAGDAEQAARHRELALPARGENASPPGGVK